MTQKPELSQNLLNELSEKRSELVSGKSNLVPYLEEVLEVAKQNSFLEVEMEVYYWIAWNNYKKGEYKKSEVYNKKSLTLALTLKKEAKEASIYNNTSLLYKIQGQTKEAINLLFKSVEIYERTNNKIKLIIAYTNLGAQFTDIGEIDKGETYFLKAMEQNKGLGKDKIASQIEANLAIIYIEKRDYVKAQKYAEMAIAIASEEKNIDYLCFCYYVLSNVFMEKEQFEKALENIELAIKLATELNQEQFKLTITIGKAKILVKLKEFTKAKKILDAEFEKLKDRASIASGHLSYYKIYKLENNGTKALFHYEKYIDIIEKTEGKENKQFLAKLEAKYQNELKEKEKEILRLQKIEMEQKALRAQLNPHFFFNSLNSINKFIQENDSDNATKFLYKFSNLMRKTLENSEESFITIEDEVSFLKDYLELEQLRFNNLFKFEIIIDEEIEEDFVKIPTMFLQPYIENCIKHGVNGIENGLIKISFLYENEDTLTCTIEDNGRGIAESKSSHQSMGTKIMQGRIENLKKQFKKEYAVSIENINSKKLNTKVILNIPIIN